jgi:segregation and condensation protein B
MSENELQSPEIEATKIKSILESLLFINERPIDVTELHGILGVDKKMVETCLSELITEYSQRNCGICIVQIAGGYQMCTSPANEPWIKKMYQERGKQKLSAAAMETLAIIAYKQPITRMEIEAIRGVNADVVTRNLENMGLVKTAGRKEVIGRPFLYVTTGKFLEYFGLNELKDLPPLEEFAQMAKDDGLVDENAVDVPIETVAEAQSECASNETDTNIKEEVQE